MTGVFFIFCETGSEGPHYAFQDDRYILENPNMPTGIEWKYDGLHYVKPGDYVKINKPDGSLLFEGTLVLKRAWNLQMVPTCLSDDEVLEWTKAFEDRYHGEFFESDDPDEVA